MKNKMPIVGLDFNNFSEAEKNKYADLFCEGSEELRSFLIFLWDKQIVTYGCCIGHGENKFDIPYISFDVGNIKKEVLNNIIKICYHDFCGKISISSVLAKKNNSLKRMIVFTFKSFDLLQNSQFFKYLQTTFLNCINDIKDCKNFAVTKKLGYYINDLIDVLYISNEKLHNGDEFKDIKEIQINNNRVVIKTNLVTPSHLINVKNMIWADGVRDDKLKWDQISKSTFYKIKRNKYLVANKNFDNLIVVDKIYITENNLKNAKTEFKKSQTKYNHKKLRKIFKHL